MEHEIYCITNREHCVAIDRDIVLQIAILIHTVGLWSINERQYEPILIVKIVDCIFKTISSHHV